MRSSLDATKLGAGTYPLLLNGRVRGNVVSTVKRSVLKELPPGIVQGIYSLDNFLVMFIAGRVWYQNVADSWGPKPILGFRLSPTVGQIHMVSVPSSTLNFKRKLVSADIADIERTTTPVATSIRGGLAMDGINQDIVIYPTADGLAVRQTQTFAEWHLDPANPDAQEYVPVGLYPLWTGYKVRKVAKDSSGAYTRILESVSGRPLDWVIEITASGEKVAPDRTAHAVAYEPVTAMYASASQETAFIVGTNLRTFGVFEDRDTLIFGEPFLRTIPLFAAGAVSHWASIDVGGELTFVGRNSILGVTATTQEAANVANRSVSRNRVFSAPISLLLDTTTEAAVARFDDYALYAMNTVLGPAVVVYDINLSAFVSIDQWKGVGRIRQFALTSSNGNEQLWCYTDDSQVFEVFAAEETETARLYLGDVSSQNAFLNHSITSVAARFGGLSAPIEVTVDIYKDRLLVDRLTRVVDGDALFNGSPLPTDEARVKTVNGFVADVSDKREAFATGALIQWSGEGKLSYFAAAINVLDVSNTNKAATPDMTKLAFIADSDDAGLVDGTPVLTKIVEQINLFAPELVIGGGDHLYQTGSQADYDAIKPYYGKLSADFIASPGNHDLDTDFGKVFFNFYGHGQRYKAIRVSRLVEVFFLNSGYSSGLALDAAPNAEPSGNDVASIQARWLQQTMLASDARCKIVVLHHPPYTDDSAYRPGYPRLRWPFRAWGATIVLAGHAHSYQRIWKDDTYYINAGTAGATLRELSRAKTYLTSFSDDTNFGYGEIVVYPYRMTWSFKKYDGTILDKVSIRL